MQSTTTYYAHNAQAEKSSTAKAHIRKDGFQKILLFAGILGCIALAVNI